MNIIGNALNELYRIFGILNHDKFNDELPEPVITIQKGKGSIMGYFTLGKVWRNKNDVEDGDTSEQEDDENAMYEINIDPRWFYKNSVAETVETLLHEMVHFYNKIQNINDCNGSIHNKKFKSAAENVGLIVTKGDSVGYGYTSLSEELEKYIRNIIKPVESAFDYFRTSVIKEKEKKKRKKKTFTYTCPECGQVVKGKKDILVKCGQCNVDMEMEDVEDED